MKTATALRLFAFGAAVVCVWAPTAVAEDLDSRLLAVIGSHGYMILDPGRAIEAAHNYCTFIRQGNTESQAQQLTEAQAAHENPLGELLGISVSYSFGLGARYDADRELAELASSAAMVYPNCEGPLAHVGQRY